MAVRKRKIAAITAGVAVVGALVVGGVVGWALQQREENPVARPEYYVPASYREVRQSPGHVAHLGVEDVECVDCHEPSDGGIGGVVEASCTESDCHAEIPEEIHAAHLPPTTPSEGEAPAAVEAPSCLGCHSFTPEADFAAKDCMRCHVEPLGETAMVVRHADTDCMGCHRPHAEEPLAVANCLECHDRHETAHGKVEPPDGCLVCHEAHPEFMLASDRCAVCHSERGDMEGPVVSELSATFTGHDDCTTCHASPAGDAVSRTCADCHRGRQVFAQGEVAQHRSCTNCHRPHAARASAEGACRRCHQDVRSDHPRAQGPCTSCHTAHPRSREMIASGGSVACTSCHQIAPSDAQAHAGELSCSGCHQPHQFRARTSRQLCTSCHETESQLTARQPGHQDCADCHTNAAHHPTRQPRSCGQCHREEQATAPGGHRQCNVCHLSHDGALKPRANQCSTCHQAQGRRAVAHSQQECSTCHRAHGPGGVARPPSCTSCHSTGELPGLHATQRHQDCADCHAPHETEPQRGRESCLTCHEDMANHEPNARVCTGCHIFRN